MEDEKLGLHDMIMKTDNKDLNNLEYNTYETAIYDATNEETVLYFRMT